MHRLLDSVAKTRVVEVVEDMSRRQATRREPAPLRPSALPFPVGWQPAAPSDTPAGMAGG